MDKIITTTRSDDLKSKFVSIPTRTDFTLYYSSKSLTGVSVRSSVLNNNPMATTHFWLIAKTQKSQLPYIIQKLEIRVHPRGSIEMTAK